MMKTFFCCIFSLGVLFSWTAALAGEPVVQLKPGDRIEFTRFEGQRTRATVTEVSPNGQSLQVLQDNGETFSFVISEAYAARYAVVRLSGGAAVSNPDHQAKPSRAPVLCPNLQAKQGAVPDKALLRRLVTCWFEDTSLGGTNAGRVVNIDIQSFDVGRVFKSANTLAYRDPKAPITPVKVKLEQRVYTQSDVRVTRDAVYEFTVYVDYYDRWSVNPRIIEMGSLSTIPLHLRN